MKILNSDLLILLRIISIFIVSISITFFSMPSIIYVAKKKQLHQTTPYLGGIGIYATVILVSSIFKVSVAFQQWHCVVGVSLMLFFAGLRNDLVAIKPYKRLMIQVIAAMTAVLMSDIRLHSLMGVLGVYELSYYVSFVISVITITFLISAFNLIDGLDGLTGSLSLLFFLILGCLFAFFFKIGQAMICFCIAGTLTGFLHFNTAPVKIFMGYSGSMVIGFFAAVMCLEYLRISNINQVYEHYSANIFNKNGILILFSMIIVPVMDTLRVFFYHAIKGAPSFQMPTNHIYHCLIQLGLCPRKIILLSMLTTISFIGIAVILIKLRVNINFSLLIITLISILLFSFIDLRHKKSLTKAKF